jgi:hypothetical protein
MRLDRLALAALACSAGLAGASPAQADAALRACKPVLNPYPHTRYAGVDLTRIRTSTRSCETARNVARGAHRRALKITPDDRFRRFSWHGWAVTGDLQPERDRYVARRNGRQVRWRF